jgi:hypothetical protein
LLSINLILKYLEFWKAIGEKILQSLLVHLNKSAYRLIIDKFKFGVRKKPGDLLGGGVSTTSFLASGKPTPYRKKS